MWDASSSDVEGNTIGIKILKQKYPNLFQDIAK